MFKYSIFVFVIFCILFSSCENELNDDKYIYQWSVSRYNNWDVQEKTHKIFRLDSIIFDTVQFHNGNSKTNNYLLQVIHSIENNWKFKDYQIDTAMDIVFKDTSYLSGIISIYDTYCPFGNNDSIYKIRNYFSYLKDPKDSTKYSEFNFHYTPKFGIFMFDFMHVPDIYKLERIIRIKRTQKKVILDLSHIPILLCDTNQLYFLPVKISEHKFQKNYK